MTSSTRPSVGRFRMRNGETAEVHGKNGDPHPYPWMGCIPGREDQDGWDGAGRSWADAAYDLVEKIDMPTEQLLRSYRVEWAIDIDGATSPEDAARQAFAHMQRPGTTANAFDVYEKDGTGEPVHVDLMEVGVEPTT